MFIAELFHSNDFLSLCDLTEKLSGLKEKWNPYSKLIKPNIFFKNTVSWTFRCSLLNWCGEPAKLGTRAVSLATSAKNEWIRPICANEKAKFIVKVTYVSSWVRVRIWTRGQRILMIPAHYSLCLNDISWTYNMRRVDISFYVSFYKLHFSQVLTMHLTRTSSAKLLYLFLQSLFKILEVKGSNPSWELFFFIF